MQFSKLANNEKKLFVLRVLMENEVAVTTSPQKEINQFLLSSDHSVLHSNLYLQ
jgi:hypothetical protein